MAEDLFHCRKEKGEWTGGTLTVNSNTDGETLKRHLYSLLSKLVSQLHPKRTANSVDRTECMIYDSLSGLLLLQSCLNGVKVLCHHEFHNFWLQTSHHVPPHEMLHSDACQIRFDRTCFQAWVMPAPSIDHKQYCCPRCPRHLEIFSHSHLGLLSQAPGCLILCFRCFW